MSWNRLLILDFLALIHWPAFRHLRAKAYFAHMNCNYTHGMTDSALRSILDDMIAENWVRSFDSEGVARFELTGLGGAKWEAERVPLWDMYCFGSQGVTEDDAEVCVVTKQACHVMLRELRERGFRHACTTDCTCFRSAENWPHWRTWGSWCISGPNLPSAMDAMVEDGAYDHDWWSGLADLQDLRERQSGS